MRYCLFKKKELEIRNHMKLKGDAAIFHKFIEIYTLHSIFKELFEISLCIKMPIIPKNWKFDATLMYQKHEIYLKS